MNPLVAAILPTLVQLAEHLIQAEGPKALEFLQTELDKLAKKYEPKA